MNCFVPKVVSVIGFVYMVEFVSLVNMFSKLLGCLLNLVHMSTLLKKCLCIRSEGRKP